MRCPNATAGPVCLRLLGLLMGVVPYFSLVRTSERLPTWTMRDVWSGTIRESSMESMWRVDRVFPCRVYIDSNHRDSQI
jgi:hypothetical protein